MSSGGDSLVVIQPAEQTVEASSGAGAVVLTPATQRVIAQTPPPVIVQTGPAPATEAAAGAPTVVVQTATRDVIRAGGGLQGQQGPPGPPGDVTFVFTQAVPAALWTISHGLGRYPSVTVVDSSGQQVIGNVQFLSPVQLTIAFALPFAGVAYLN